MHSPAVVEPATLVVLTSTDEDGDDVADEGAFETIYSCDMQPDPRSARDVLAFMLTPVEAFTTPGDEDELEAVSQLLEGAKMQALQRWYGLHTAAGSN